MLKLLREVYHAARRTPCVNAGSGKRYLSIEVTDEALQSMRVAISARNFPADNRTPKNCTPAASLEGRAHAMLHILAKDSKRLSFASSLLRDLTMATSIDRGNPYFTAAVAVVIEACLRDGKLTEAFEHFNASREVRLDNPIYESLIASICDQVDDEKQNGMTTSEDFAQWPVPQHITNLVALVEVLDSHQVVLNWEATTRAICTLVIYGRAASALSLWTGRCRASSRPPSYLTTSPATQRETTACSSSDYSGDNEERDKVMAGVAWADAAVKAVVDDSAVSPEYICDVMNATSDRIDMLKGELKVEDEVPVVDEDSHGIDMFKSLLPESLSRSSPEFLSSAEDAALQRLQCDASSILARMQEHCNEWDLNGLFAYIEDPDNFFGDFDEDEEDAIASHIDDLIDPVEFERIIGACGDDNGEDEEEQDGDWDKDENEFEKVEEEGESSSEEEESPDTRVVGPKKESDTKTRDK